MKTRIRHSSFVIRHSERGVALVITLIMLAVITFMAVTFLVVSRSERGSVATQTDMTMARLAADTARDRAIAEMLSPIMASNNPFYYGLLVSTNYININGFNPTGLLPNDLLNVNYDYEATPPYLPLTLAEQLQNLQNLFFNPRPPVFIVTNALSIVSNDFRFYVDLNRNGAFEPTGVMPYTNAGPWSSYWPVIGPPTYVVGDPQWIGLLQHPEYYHSPTNLFTSRFAYLVVPIGQDLDMNIVHNYAKPSLIPGNAATPWPDGFLRNQGIVPGELNLAGFLADLNTNVWPYPVLSPVSPFNGFGLSAIYSYNTNLSYQSAGYAAEDAAAFVQYRYGATNKALLATVRSLFGTPGANAISADPLDAYSEGPLMTGTSWPPLGFVGLNPNLTRVNTYWVGADSPNRFFTLGDLFDRSKFPVPGGRNPLTFVDRLNMAGADTNSTYNRYTYYRLLSQLGTDSATAPQDKMNLNYCNVTNGYVVPGMETNFLPWQPTNFFINAAIRLMVDSGYTVGALNSTSNLLVTNVLFSGGVPVLVTNLQIPIWPTNYYTPSLHRLLQLAANLYDATTNRMDGSYGTYASSPPYYHLPTIFRPLFPPPGKNANGQISIVGYQEVLDSDTFTSILPGTPPLDLSDATDRNKLLSGGGRVYMVYNVPLVIGAKKGLPSFDVLAMDTQIQAARKLIYHRQGELSGQLVPTPNTGAINEIDPEYLLSVTNVVGLQAWNSYAENYTRSVTLEAWPDTSVYVTNLDTGAWLNQPAYLPGYYYRQPTTPPAPYVTTIWPGYSATYPSTSFITPLGPLNTPTTNYTFMPTNTVYSRTQQKFVVNGYPDRTPGSTNYHIPHIQLTVKARLQFALVDRTTRRLIDYVNLATNQTIDVTYALMHNQDGSLACGAAYSQNLQANIISGAMWCTNSAGGAVADSIPTFGVRLQIDASAGNVPNADWTSSLPDPIYGTDKAKSVTRFQAQFGLGLGGYPLVSPFAAPFQPFRNIHLVTLWQANDPLVHYTVGDLQNITDFPQSAYLDTLPKTLPPNNFAAVNDRYEPWGGNPTSGSGSPTINEWRVKDPVAQQFGNSDAWDFPTNKFPNPGWLGRVHRGTPWQTVYLKSGLPLDANPKIPVNWIRWTGNGMMVTNWGQLSTNLTQFGLVAWTNGLGRLLTNQMAYDAGFSQPTNDWRLVDLFSTSFDANATRGRLSINQTNLAAWSAVLSGVIALTNSATGVLSPWVIQPAGVYDPDPAVSNTWPAIVRIVNAINIVRTNITNPNLPVFPNQAFQRLGDILSVPELTVASPFLSSPLVPGTPPSPPLSDAAVERIPQQILGLLKADSTPRFVIYSFGQTLKPANHSRMTSGPFFGLVTNYQITAEVATKTVVRFDGVQPYQIGSVTSLTNLHPVIESFNVLPPD